MGVLDTFEIGRQGLNVHSKRIQVAAKNIANLDTPNYVRKIPVLNATEDISFAGLLNTMKEDVFGIGTIPFISGGVRFTGLVEDPTQGEKIYRPGHPDADEEGYIRMSNVNPMVMAIARTMSNRALEIGQ